MNKPYLTTMTYRGQEYHAVVEEENGCITAFKEKAEAEDYLADLIDDQQISILNDLPEGTPQ